MTSYFREELQKSAAEGKKKGLTTGQKVALGVGIPLGVAALGGLGFGISRLAGEFGPRVGKFRTPYTPYTPPPSPRSPHIDDVIDLFPSRDAAGRLVYSSDKHPSATTTNTLFRALTKRSAVENPRILAHFWAQLLEAQKKLQDAAPRIYARNPEALPAHLSQLSKLDDAIRATESRLIDRPPPVLH